MNDGELLQAFAQLKTDLIGHIDRQKTDLLDHIDKSQDKLRADLLDHFHGVGAQLHAQIQDLEKRMDDRLTASEGRLKLQGGLINSGSRAIARIIEWTESTDTNLIEHLRRLTEAEKRMTDLERKSG